MTTAPFPLSKGYSIIRDGKITNVPWPAPALDCAACGRVIGKTAAHNVTDDMRVLCSRCLTGGQRKHAAFFPGCEVPWHDMHDHLKHVAGTRAGAAAALGVWP